MNYWVEKRKFESQVSTWDFKTALGDTIKEKYKNMYIKIVEVSNVINRKRIGGKR